MKIRQIIVIILTFLIIIQINSYIGISENNDFFDSNKYCRSINPKTASIPNNYDYLWCQGKFGKITSLELSPDGKHIVIGGERVLILNSTTLEIEKELTNQSALRDGVKWSPNGNNIAVRDDKTIKIFNFTTGEYYYVASPEVFGYHSDYITSLIWSPDSSKIAYGLENGSVEIVDIYTKKIIITFTEFSYYTKSLAWSPDGTKIAIGDYWIIEDGSGTFGELKILYANNGTNVSGMSHWIAAQYLDWNPNSTYLAIGHVYIGLMEYSGWLSVLNVNNGEIIYSSEEFSSLPNHVNWSYDGKKIIVSHSNIEIFDINAHASMKEILKSHYKAIWSKDNNDIIVGSYNNILEIMDSTTEIVKKSLTSDGHTNNYIKFCKFSGDGKRILTYAYEWNREPEYYIWDANNGNLLYKLNKGSKYFSPDGSKIAIHDGTNISIIDITTGNEIKKFYSPIVNSSGYDYKYPYKVQALAWSNDGNKLAIGYQTDDSIEKRNLTIRIWDIDNDKILKNLTGHNDSVAYLYWSPNDQLIASGDWYLINFWNISSGKFFLNFTETTYGKFSIGWCPNDILIASCLDYDFDTLYIWNLTFKSIIKTINLSNGYGNYGVLKWSKNSDRLFYFSGANTIKIWDTETWKCISELHEFTIKTVDWDLINDRITICSDNIIKVLTKSLYPKIKSVYPFNNAINIPIDSNISIEFNHYMNQTSVESSFSISSGVTGEFHWKGNILIFVPDSNLEYNTSYIVKISGSAKNLNNYYLDGNRNGIIEGSPIDDFIWNFKTIIPDLIPPKILLVKPKNNDKNVSLNTTIQIYFNEPMDKQTTENEFVISPSISGSFDWTDKNKVLQFIPTYNFSFQTNYSIVVSADAKDYAGNRLDGNRNGISEGSPIDDFTWSFMTESYSVEKFIPISILVFPLNNSIIATPTPLLQWDLYNDSQSDIPTVYYDVYLGANLTKVKNLDNSVLLFSNITNNSIRTMTPLNIYYYWTIIPHTNFSYGYCISGIFQFSPDLPPMDLVPPQIISTIPSNNSKDVNIDTNIQIFFSESMNCSSVEEAFTINSIVEGEFKWSGNDSILTYYPQNYLDISKNYTVTVTSFAKDTSDNPLDGNRDFNIDGSPIDDYSWTFSTADIINLMPTIKLDSPLNGSIFSLNDTIYFDCLNTTDPDGDILEFLWKSNISGILSTAPQFNTFLPIGHHQITLFVNDGHGHNISSSVNIIVTPWNRPPIAIIDHPKNNALFNTTDIIRFEATSSYDLDLDTLEFYWHSNISGGFGYSSKFSTQLPEGRHLITLFINDGHYHNVSISINITILNQTSEPFSGPGDSDPNPPSTGKDTNFFSRYGLYLGIILVIIIVVIFGFAAATEVGKYGVLGAMVPLYRRLKGKEVLDNETRGMIRGYILANPGEHYSVIKRTLGLKNGTLTYHLKILENEGIIHSKRDGIFKRFFPIEERVPENIMHITKAQELILNEIISTPGITQKELGEKTKKSHQIINYHVKKLISAGLIKSERLGKVNKYYPVE